MALDLELPKLSRREFLIWSSCAALSLPFLSSLDDLSDVASRERWRDLPIGEVVRRVGSHFIGSPYIGGTLEESGPEHCVVRLDGFDCVTLYEISLCAARIVRKGEKLSKGNLTHELTLVRYRGGKLDGYPSRLHYTMDWLLDNEAKGIVKILEPDCSSHLKKKIDFMTSHRKLYTQLADSGLFARMGEIELALSGREVAYTTRSRVGDLSAALKDGDILAFTTATPGLDCAHTGICAMRDGVPHLLHASTDANKVVLGPTVTSYVAKHAKLTGVIAARPLEPT